MNHGRDVRIERDDAAGRFEAFAGDERAGMVTYRRRDGVLVLEHTEVCDDFEGRGIGSRLAAAALDAARQEGVRVEPRCPFIAAYIERHPEYGDLVVA